MRRAGRKQKLSWEQVKMLIIWSDELELLGTRAQAMRHASDQWQRRRRALKSRKYWCAQMGISRNTLLTYVKRRHKK